MSSETKKIGPEQMPEKDGFYAKGFVNVVGVSKKGNPEYSIVVGKKMLTLYTDKIYGEGEKVLIELNLFEDAMRASEARA